MPRGERSQTWFPELVAELRQSWRTDPTWETVINLRDQLQQRLEHILKSRGIKPATVRCLHCGHVGPGKSPAISVRAVLLALRRFGIESEDRVRGVSVRFRGAVELQAQRTAGPRCSPATAEPGRSAAAHREARD